MSTSEGDRHQARAKPRLFVALTLPDVTRRRLEMWQRTEIGDLPGVRPVAAPQLHITVAFLGNRPAAEVEAIAVVMRDRATGTVLLPLESVGYRETRHVGMVTLREIPASGGPRATRAAELAERLMKALAALGVYRLERRPWLPHITVARFKTGPRLTPDPPDLQPFSPSEVVLYESQPGPGGSIYIPWASVPLRARANH